MDDWKIASITTPDVSCPPKRIVLIEDEWAIADTVLYALSTEGFTAVGCASGQIGLATCQAQRPDLVILDVGLPDINGFEVYRQLQQYWVQQHITIPVIFLTARHSEIDRVAGLEMGADDYVVKPFSPRELTARVRAVLRRTVNSMPHPASLPSIPSTIASEPSTASAIFTVDESQCQIRYYGTVLELSRIEYRLLKALIEQPRRVLSREALLNQAWDHPEHSLDRTVDTHIKTVRAKLRAIRPERDPIKTHRGFGYSLNLYKTDDER